MLGPYRVLDLTDVRGQLAGMILADLGAEVIRIEPPEGSAARRVGPLLPDGPDAERSLSFAAYNRNKRSVVLDLSQSAGRSRFLELAAGSDFVIDSGARGAIDFEELRSVVPHIVHVRISAFGSDGPLAERAAADLTIAAMGGAVALQGDPDREPLRLSVPQVWRHAGAEAAVAALIGHARVRTSGEGVFVDVSAQAAMTWTMMNAMSAFAIQHRDFERAGSILQLGNVAGETVHACADGHVVAVALGRSIPALAEWMQEDGLIDHSFVAREEWSTYDDRFTRGEEIAVPREELEALFSSFFLRNKKQELFSRGLELGVTLAPVNTMQDLIAFEQLGAREYFERIELPNGARVQSPKAFARLDGAVCETARAPRLGEDTEQILNDHKVSPRSAASYSDAAQVLPLAGVRVVDFSWVGVGPITGKYLADHGADVVRVEWDGRPDGLRTAGPFKDGIPGWNRSHFYGEFNTSKRSLALDLKHPGAKEIKDRLLGWADIALESFTPGTIDRLGIGFEAAQAVNPGIIMASTCLMGQTGPVATMAGFGYHAAAIAGFYELTGYSDRPPVGPWNAYTDTVAPRFLAATVLAALDHKRRTGEGTHIDLSQLEASLILLAPELLAAQATDETFSRIGNRARDAAPQSVYPCRGDDSWCAIAVDDDRQWERLRIALGSPEWSRDSVLDNAEGRLAGQREIDDRIAEWTRSRDAGDVVEVLAAAGVPVAPVQRSRDLLTDPQLAHRRFHRTFDHPEMGSVPYSGHQFRVSGYDNGPRGPAPLLGQHTIEVLSESLGFEDEKIGELFAEGVVA